VENKKEKNDNTTEEDFLKFKEKLELTANEFKIIKILRQPYKKYKIWWVGVEMENNQNEIKQIEIPCKNKKEAEKISLGKITTYKIKKDDNK